MKNIEVTIVQKLFSVYWEIQLGVLRFEASAKASNNAFWAYTYMYETQLKERNGMKCRGFKGVESPIKHLEEIWGNITLLRRL